jgi:tetratricopeptide (TPR) repeat protein
MDRDEDMQSSEARGVIHNAVAAFNSGRYEDAQLSCEQGLLRQPQEPTLNHLLAAMLFKRGDFAYAHKRIEVSLAVDPNNKAALLLAGRIARAEKDFEGALSYLRRAAELAQNAEILLETARTLDQSGSPAQAEDVWRVILKALPDCAEALARLGRLAWENGSHAEAVALLERAAKKDAPASVWFDLGLAKQDLRDHIGAAAAYRRALRRKADYAEAAMNLGVVLQNAGDLDSAIEAYGEAYRLRHSMFGMIAMALTSAPCGRIWLEENELRELLAS